MQVTSWSLATRQRAEAVNGPTADGWPWSVPAFRWSEAPVANLTHRCGGAQEAFRVCTGFRKRLCGQRGFVSQCLIQPQTAPGVPPTCCLCRGMPERYSFTFEVMDPLSPVPATCARSRGLGGESGVLALNLAL